MSFVVSRVEKEAPDGNLYLAAINAEKWRWLPKGDAIVFGEKAVAQGIASAWNARPQSTDLAFVDEVE